MKEKIGFFALLTTVLLLGVAMGVIPVLLYGTLAVAQTPAGQGVVASTASADPITQIVGGIVQLASSTPGGIVALVTTLYAAGPRLTSRLGLGTDPAVIAQQARIDERSRETRRETRRLRQTVHWLANVVMVLIPPDVQIPPRPRYDDDDETDSDEPKSGDR